MLLDRDVRVQCDLIERGYIDRAGLRNHLTAAVQRDYRLKGTVSAIVAHNGDSVVPNLERPVV
jgi:hypothetical protein